VHGEAPDHWQAPLGLLCFCGCKLAEVGVGVCGETVVGA